VKDDIPTPVAPTAGIDWATDTNELCIVDAAGQVLLAPQHWRWMPPGSASSSASSSGSLGRPGRDRTARRPVVDALLAADIEVVVITPRQVKNLRSRYGSAGNKDDRFDAFVLADTLRTDPGLLRPLQPDSDPDRGAAPGRACPRRPGRDPRRAGQPAARPPQAGLSRRGGPVRRSGLADQPGVPHPLPHPGQGRLAVGQAARCVAVRPALLGPHQDRRAARTAPERPGRTQPAMPATPPDAPPWPWSTRSRASAPRSGCSRPRSPSSSPPTPTHTSSPRCPGREDPRRQAAGRDRRRPRPLPHRRRAGRPRRRVSLHARLGTPPRRQLPLGLRQEAARRRHGLRRRLPPRLALGRRHLQPAPRRRQDPPAHRAHPRPRLAPRHLALLARRRRLRPRPTRRRPTISRPQLDTGHLMRGRAPAARRRRARAGGSACG
jgi:hypothetical protein